MIERVERFQPLFRERGWERTLKVYEALREGKEAEASLVKLAREEGYYGIHYGDAVSLAIFCPNAAAKAACWAIVSMAQGKHKEASARLEEAEEYLSEYNNVVGIDSRR